jgi:hypothetical protein
MTVSLFDDLSERAFHSDGPVAAVEELDLAIAPPPDEKASVRNSAKRSQATQLVELAAGAELFHSPEGEAFATIAIEAHHETWPLRSGALRKWLQRKFYVSSGFAPNAQALQDALGVFEGEALFEGEERVVAVRHAEFDGAMYLDLGTSIGRRSRSRPPPGRSSPIRPCASAVRAGYARSRCLCRAVTSKSYASS